jgi:SAM-dependent methyltransferase
MHRETPETALFDLREVFEVEDYLFAYGDALTDARSDAEVDTVVAILQIVPGMKILDLACGFGRHSNRLAVRDCDVTGVDLMAGFLDIARSQAPATGAQYVQGDMRELDIDSAFDRVVLLFSSFGYFEDQENEGVLARMARALRPEGRLLIDLINRDALLKTLPATEVIEKGTDLLINRCSFDMLSGRFHNRRIVIRDGIRKDKPYSTRVYNANEITRMVADAGLVDCRLLDESGKPLGPGSRRMMVMATRPR